MPGEGGGYFATLQRALADTRALETDFSVLVNRRDALTRQLRGERPALPNDSSSASGGFSLPQNDLDARISDLEASIQEMLTRYTEKWPDVIAARDQLDRLYKQRETGLAELTESGGADTRVFSNNPVYQQLQIAINETNVDIAAVEGKIVSFRRQVADLQAKVNVIPEIEAKLAALTRDYDQIRAVYAELRERLEQEQLRRKRIGWNGVTFRIIDPPNVDLEPVSPNRSRLLILVVLGGLLSGAGLAYLLHQVRPVFIDERSLRKVTGLPVLGAVSRAWLSRHSKQRRRELFTLLAAAAGIVILLTLVLIFQDAAVQAAYDLRRLASL